ncbi:MAG: transglutaminase domain-containing protein [Bacteroidota bacterium]
MEFLPPRRLITCLVIFCVQIIIADEFPPPPISWGENIKPDLEMNSYPADTNASAIILCDYGETKLNSNYQLEYRRHLRIKILNQNGYRWGTHSIDVYDNKDNGDRLRDIEAITYQLDGEGSVTEYELDDDDIFKEKITEGFLRYKFTLPSLQPGCVIEIRYMIVTESLWNIRNWTFQHDEPVIWSEYRLLHPSSIAFAVLTNGFEKFDINSQTDMKVYYSGSVASFYGGNIINCVFWRWGMKNIPALREEPYITTLDDYRNKVDIQLAGYALYGGGSRKVLNTWEELTKELNEHKYIGERVIPSGGVKKLVSSIISGAHSPLEKAAAIYSWVTASILWTGTQSIFSQQRADEVIESKKGNAAEINYLLVSLFRAAGLHSDPIILSTRGNGKLQDLYPITNQFNLGMARLTVDGKQYYLDATDPLRPFPMVPSKVIGVRALVVHSGSAKEWAVIPAAEKSITTALATLTLQENGSFTGSVEGLYKQYANVAIRNELTAKKPDEIVRDNFSLDHAVISVDSVAVTDKDSINKPIGLKALISADTYALGQGDILYVNHHIISRWKDNPFKRPNRSFPVDYTYAREYTGIYNIVFPDSFEIKESLRDKYLALNDLVVYRRQSKIENNRMQLITKFEIRSREISPQHYHRLQDLYSAIIQTESEQIVLQKIARPQPVETIVPLPQQTPKAKKQAQKKK